MLYSCCESYRVIGGYPWSLRSKGVFFVYIDILREIWKTEVMEMTAYEAIMVMLGTLTLIMSVIGIIVKLLLYIIENNAKK